MVPREKIKYDEYKLKAFLDTNVILECRPLVELPWQEIDPDGPIVALMTPTAIKEVDSKKQDGRIGKRAREFNRLIASVAAGGLPIVIREGGPRVELALARTGRIPWDQYDDLDPEDGDSRIVAEALHAKDMSAIGKLIVSHDIKPIAIASNYDLGTFHVSDDWLRPPEPHPKEREIQKLNQRIAQYQASEPQFEINVDLMDNEPIVLRHIEDLSEIERADIQRKIEELHPRAQQGRNSQIFGHQFSRYDYSYEKKFDAYLNKIPSFVSLYERRIEQLFNQVPFRISVTNVGKVQAENMLIEVKINSGWLHDRFAFISPMGPTVPKPRSYPDIPMPNIRNIIPPHVGRHETQYKNIPNCKKSFSVTCTDFRHGQNYKFDGVVGFDVQVSEKTEISVSVTASNFRGDSLVRMPIKIDRKICHISDLVNLESLRLVSHIHMEKVLDDENYEKIDFKTLQGDDEDDY